MRKLATLLAFTLVLPGYACVTCDRRLQSEIFGSTFYPNLALMLSAFITLGLVVIILAVVALKNRGTATPELFNRAPLIAAAMVLGIGLGGFLDGILLHQVLQFHNVLSAKIPPVDLMTKNVNMFWDGIFHTFTLLVTFTGTLLLWKVMARPGVDRSGRLLAGGYLVGWAVFNFIEGIIDHHVLRLHNVRENSAFTESWNYGFLGLSAVLLVAGIIVIGRKRAVMPL